MWRDILSNGNAEEIQEFLTNIADDTERNHVVNGIFEEDQEVRKWSSPEHKKFVVITPLAMVMSCASISGMECLLRHGANVSSQDPYGHNPVHLIICFSFIKPQLNHIWVAMFEKLVAFLPSKSLKQMLMAENNEGLRPLEFAAKQGTLEIAMLVWNTPVLYLHRSKSLPGGKYKLFDITEYESGDRISKSPVVALTMFNECQLNNSFCTTLLQHPWIHALLQVKAKINYMFLIICFISRLLYFITYMMLEINMIRQSLYTGHNASSSDCTNYMFKFVRDINCNETIVAWILLVIAVIYTAADITDFIRSLLPEHQIFMYNLSGRKSTIAGNWYYGTSIFLSNMCILSGCTMYLIDSTSNGSNLIRLAAPPLMFISMMYYLQSVPVLGFYIISMQRMVISLAVFSILSFSLMAPFQLSFIMILATGLETGCPPGFTEFLESYYSMFILMLGLRNFDKYEVVNNQEWLWFLHVIYMFSSAILLLNFLIATMANQMSFVRQHKDVIQIIQTMSMFVQVEQQWRWLMKRYYDWAKQRYFIYEDGKILMPCVFTDDSATEERGVANEKMNP